MNDLRGSHFLSGHLCTLKPKKLKTFFQKTYVFSQPWRQWAVITWN